MEYSLSKTAQALIWAYKKGYIAKNNQVISHLGNSLKLRKTKGYLNFSVRPDWETNRTRTYNIYIHRLVAYEKFGDKMFDGDLLVRHLDENPLNNHPDNLELGTDHDNMMDRKPEARLRYALKATIVNRKFSDLEIELIRQDSKIHKLTYPQIMKKWNISSKGTLSYIINNKYKTKV